MTDTPGGPPERSPHQGVHGEEAAQALADHLARCRKVDAAVVQDGNADLTVARMLADGWVYQGLEYAGGKRVRYMKPPPGWSPEGGGTPDRSPHQGVHGEQGR